MRRWRSATIVAFVGLSAAVAGLTLGSGSDGSGPSLYPTRFEIDAAAPVDRAGKTLDVVVQDGTCGSEDHEDPASRFDHAEVRAEPFAYLVTVWMRRQASQERKDAVCAGVGTTFRKRLTLPSTIGSRGVVTVADRHNDDLVVIAPEGRTAARALVPRFLYTGAACDDVERYFRALRRDTWCFF